MSTQPQGLANPLERYWRRVTPDNATLVLVDYLTGFESALKTMGRPEYRNNLTALCEVATIFKLPVIVIGDNGDGRRGEFMPQVEAYFPDAPRIPRTMPSAWREPRFVETVRSFGRPKLILAGISIDNCVLLTALDAMRDGLDVHVVADVSGAESALIERVGLDRLIQAGAVPTTWVSLGSELLTDWRTPEGERLGKVYSERTNYF
jgi:hypothetical protein